MSYSIRPFRPSSSPPSPQKRPSWVVPSVLLLALWLAAKISGNIPNSKELTQIHQALPLFLGFVAFAACFYFPRWPEWAQAFAAIVFFLIVYLGVDLLFGKPGYPENGTDEIRPRDTKYQPVIDFDVLRKGEQSFEIYAELKACDRSKAAHPQKVYLGETTQKGWNSFSLPLAGINWGYIKSMDGEPPPCFEIHIFQLTGKSKGELLGTIKIE